MTLHFDECNHVLISREVVFDAWPHGLDFSVASVRSAAPPACLAHATVVFKEFNWLGYRAILPPI